MIRALGLQILHGVRTRGAARGTRSCATLPSGTQRPPEGAPEEAPPEQGASLQQESDAATPGGALVAHDAAGTALSTERLEVEERPHAEPASLVGYRQLVAAGLICGLSFYGFVQTERIDELQHEVRLAREEAFKLRQQYTKTVRVLEVDKRRPEEMSGAVAWLVNRAKDFLAS